MIKLNLKGCDSFISAKDYDEYVSKALAAFDTLYNGNGAGSEMLGWKTLPTDTPESLLEEFDAIRKDWAAKGVNLVISIGIGGSYLGARCAVEALSHSFLPNPGAPGWCLRETTCRRNTSPNCLTSRRSPIPQ